MILRGALTTPFVVSFAKAAIVTDIFLSVVAVSFTATGLKTTAGQVTDITTIAVSHPFAVQIA